MDQKPYLTCVSVNRKWKYFHTKRKYRYASYKFLGIWIIVVSYKRIEELGT